jgi:predicted transcriptional regulator
LGNVGEGVADEGDRARRASGALESEVMAALWSATGPLTSRQVRERLTVPLAYTTVMTTLTRLHVKGLVERTRSGQAFAYRPTEGAVLQAADRMTDVLTKAGDTQAVLSRFVSGLDSHQEQLLRELLTRADEGE